MQRSVDRFVRSRFGASQKPERRGQVSGSIALARVGPFADVKRGRKQLLDEHRYEAAVTSFTRALRTNPRHAEALALRARAYASLRRYDEALTDCRQCLAADPQTAEAYVARAFALHGRREFDQAIVECNRAVRIDPKLARAYAVRGLCYAETRDFDRASADAAEAIRLTLG